MKSGLFIGLLMGMGLACGPRAYGYDPNHIVLQPDQAPKELNDVGITERLGEQINPQLTFTTDAGEVVNFGSILNPPRPALLAMIYYECPTLCNLHLNGVTEVMKGLDLQVGRDFDVIAVSMDPREGAALASSKKSNYVKAYGRPESASGWHFLTGSKESIDALAQQIGFSFRWDEETQQFAHASATLVLTSSGKISRYLHGVRPELQSLKLSLLEASRGQIGSFVDRIVMFCFQYDPKKSKYTIYAWNIMRIGVVLTLLIMAVILVPLWLRERRASL